MKSTRGRGPDDLTRYFLLQPLDVARNAADRVTAKVIENAGTGELLDRPGLEVLRIALKAELPKRSSGGLLDFAGEVAGTAHAIATVEWRNAGHKPRDVPEVGPSALAGAVLVHFHGSPDSEAARILANTWRMHATMYGGTIFRPRFPSKDELRRWSELGREHQQALYSYWQEMQRAS
ncbi:hypothetical protein [Curtobacterium ammoniigenes]|uniref:hypothetical protein n=1 Tax=Curtobacterium ammoniigenes TaxID=395387 RepID=UPI000A3E217E|nr:hypothetical protein [Curtobacterium ammoniigenes]